MLPNAFFHTLIKLLYVKMKDKEKIQNIGKCGLDLDRNWFNNISNNVLITLNQEESFASYSLKEDVLYNE